MSSAVSRTLQSPDAAGLDEAVAQVAEESFFAMVDPVGETDWMECCAAHAEWLEAAVTFSGTFGGAVICRLPRATVQELAAAFLGVTEDELDPAGVLDMAGELVNMICGRWLTAAYPEGLFALARPEVRETPAPADDWRRLLVNGAPLALQLTVTMT
jgi:hypothetical protein